MDAVLSRTVSDQEEPYHCLHPQKAVPEEYSQVGNESLINYPASAR